jgi:plasmid stabilization system protein ParE
LDLRLAIGAAVGRLEALPLSGRMTSKPGVRTLIVAKFGYRMFYKIEGDDIQILHVRHGARDWPDDLA